MTTTLQTAAAEFIATLPGWARKQVRVEATADGIRLRGVFGTVSAVVSDLRGPGVVTTWDVPEDSDAPVSVEMRAAS